MSVELTEAGASTFVNGRPPRDELVRCMPQAVAYRGGGDSGTLEGHFAVFNEWTEINSMFEGHFRERIAPGAFKKTFREQTPKVLFNHGHDQMLGDKLLGRVDSLREDDIGAAYEVGLYRGLPEYLIDGLRDGQYGASFRFRVLKEDFNNDPGESADNPDGLPERTIREAQVMEFGPVTFPAYASATAQARSMISATDEEFIMRAVEHSERFSQVLDHVRAIKEEHAPDEPEETPVDEPVDEPRAEDAPDEPAEDAPILPAEEPAAVEPGDEPTPDEPEAQPGDEPTELEVETDEEDALPLEEPALATPTPRSRKYTPDSIRLPDAPTRKTKEWQLP